MRIRLTWVWVSLTWVCSRVMDRAMVSSTCMQPIHKVHRYYVTMFKLLEDGV